MYIWGMKWWIVILYTIIPVAIWGQTPLKNPKISCQLDDLPLSDALAIISRKANVEFSFNNNILPADRRYSYSFDQVAFHTILNILLRNTDLVYTELNGYIIIKQRRADEAQIEPELYSLSGVVEDAITGERLIGASVYIAGQNKGTYSNDNGYFSFYAFADSVLLQLSYVGYQAQSIPIGLYQKKELMIQLEPDGLLDSIIIVDKRYGEDIIVVAESQGGTKVSARMINKMPSMLGEPDPVHTLGWLPGVQSGTSDLGNLLIRNNENGHNLILLDGAQIYNPNHLLGLYSIFNGSAIKDVELIKGAIPAKYGERIASVVEVNGKEGDYNEMHAEGSLGMIVAKAMIEGPIKKGKSSYLFAGRRSHWDLVLRPLTSTILANNEASGGYFFDDFNVKVSHKVTERDDWSATAYWGEDRFSYEQERQEREPADLNLPPNSNYEVINGTRVSWSNLAASLKWNRRWKYNTHSTFSTFYSRYRFLVRVDSEQIGILNNSPINRNFNLLYFSGVQDLGGRLDFETTISDELKIKYGASAIWHLYQPQASGTGFLTLNETVFQTDPESEEGEVEFAPLQINAQESGIYIDAIYNVNNRWEIQAGLHLASFGNKGVFYASAQPRINVRYNLASNLWLKFMTRTNQQYAHLLNNTQYNLPTDLWVPSNDKVKPQLGWQIALGLEKRWRKKYIFQLDGYYQYIDQLSTLNPTESFQKGLTWEDKILQGIGFNYGVETAFQKIQGRLTCLISYHYSWAWRRFPLLNGGRNFPYRYNRRHVLAMLGQYQLSPKVSISGGWTISSGNFISILNRQIAFGYPSATGIQTGSYDSDASVNNFQVPTYHRLDLNIDFTKRTSTYTRKWSFGLFNAYNRKNPTFFINSFNNGNRTLSGLTIFTIIPSIKYQIKF